MDTVQLEKSSVCFFCLKPSHVEDEESEKTKLELFSLNSICRYLKILGASKSESQRNIGSHLVEEEVVLCEKCGNIRNTLSELIQLGEIIELKISYWFGVLGKTLSAGSDKSTNPEDAPSLRKSIQNQCRCKKSFLKIQVITE